MSRQGRNDASELSSSPDAKGDPLTGISVPSGATWNDEIAPGCDTNRNLPEGSKPTAKVFVAFVEKGDPDIAVSSPVAESTLKP